MFVLYVLRRNEQLYIYLDCYGRKVGDLLCFSFNFTLIFDLKAIFDRFDTSITFIVL